jgi:hypothetical protein
MKLVFTTGSGSNYARGCMHVGNNVCTSHQAKPTTCLTLELSTSRSPARLTHDHYVIKCGVCVDVVWIYRDWFEMADMNRK